MAYTDYVRRGVEHLQDYRSRKLVETCKYVQGGVLFEGVHLTPAQATSESDDDLGIIINSRLIDFLADPSEFSSKGIEKPQRGDRVIRTVQGEEIEYEVMGGGNEPPWRPMSRYRMAWRIHTSFIRSETIPT